MKVKKTFLTNSIRRDLKGLEDCELFCSGNVETAAGMQIRHGQSSATSLFGKKTEKKLEDFFYISGLWKKTFQKKSALTTTNAIGEQVREQLAGSLPEPSNPL